MLAEVIEAQNYLIKKYDGANNVKPGTYAIPTQTSKGTAFMKVIIDADMGMSNFQLFKDEELTQTWYEVEAGHES